MATFKTSLLVLSLLGLLGMSVGMSVIGPGEEMGSLVEQDSLNIDDESLNPQDEAVAQVRNKRQCPDDLSAPRMEVGHSYLRIFVRNATNLRNGDSTTQSDPYASIAAFGYGGVRKNFRTTTKRNSLNPVWNQRFTPGYMISGWDYITVSVFDSDSGNDDLVMARTVFLVSPGVHKDVCQCIDSQRRRCLCLDYTLIVDRDNCQFNPCRGGGRCIDEYRGLSCSCKSGYTGSRCQYRVGNLRFYARSGVNLPDRDPSSTSDPYVEVVARDRSGRSRRLVTSTDRNDESPSWNEWLEFGRRVWSYITVRVLDSDVETADSVLCQETRYNLNGYTRRTNVRLSCSRGSVTFDFYFGTSPTSPVGPVGPRGPPGPQG